MSASSASLPTCEREWVGRNEPIGSLAHKIARGVIGVTGAGPNGVKPQLPDMHGDAAFDRDTDSLDK